MINKMAASSVHVNVTIGSLTLSGMSEFSKMISEAVTKELEPKVIQGITAGIPVLPPDDKEEKANECELKDESKGSDEPATTSPNGKSEKSEDLEQKHSCDCHKSS